MRSFALLVALVVSSASAGQARAEAGGFFVDAVDPEPIGVRVFAATAGCGGSLPLVEHVIAPGKSISIMTDAPRLCVSQTFAPFTKVGWSMPVLVVRAAGSAPTHVRLRSHNPPGPLPAVLASTAPAIAPLVIALDGKEAIGVRVAVGKTTPCTSSDNVQLVTTVLAPGTPLVLPTNATCACVQRTKPPFMNVDWDEGQITCRPRYRIGKHHWSPPDFTKPWQVTLPSKTP